MDMFTGKHIKNRLDDSIVSGLAQERQMYLIVPALVLAIIFSYWISGAGIPGAVPQLALIGLVMYVISITRGYDVVTSQGKEYKDTYDAFKEILGVQYKIYMGRLDIVNPLVANIEGILDSNILQVDTPMYIMANDVMMSSLYKALPIYYDNPDLFAYIIGHTEWVLRLQSKNPKLMRMLSRTTTSARIRMVESIIGILLGRLRSYGSIQVDPQIEKATFFIHDFLEVSLLTRNV